jgi:hypothetical protein
MSFLNPAFLSALALVGIPLLIHLIRRRKLKVIQWAAMEFLIQSQRKQRRRLRIEELILLALRMLIVVTAVLAFARPVLRALGLPLLSQNARVYAVIVLDHSMSMEQRGADGKTSWDRARASAQEILTHVLKPGDSASLILMADRPEAVVNSPSFDLNLVAARVRAAQPVDRGTDYYATARLVDEMLKNSKAPYKEVYWLTDDQKSAWAGNKQEQARATWSDLGARARVTWVSVGAPANQRDNLAVQLLPLSRELVTPHLPARLEASIVNAGARARNNLLVNLIIDGRPADTRKISVSPNGTSSVLFPTNFPQAGTHTGRIELAQPDQADNLPRDNGAPFVVRSRDQIRVLVQDTRPNVDPTRSDSFYLMNAMAPGGAAESIAPKLREGEGLGATTLRDYDVVVITGLSGLSANDARALSDYVRAGGGLLLFPGNGTEARKANEALNSVGLLPAKLTGAKSFTDDTVITLNPGSITSHPAMSLFKDTTNLNLGSAHFTRYETLEPLTEGVDPNDLQVLIRFTNGDPAFVERKVGLGRVILAASSAGTTWNELPLKGSYVPLVYQLFTYLGAGATAHRNLHLDEPLFLTLPLSDANKPVKVTRPDGTTATQNSVLDARGVTFSYTDTRQAGIYAVAVQGSNTHDAFAVSLPDNESDLTMPSDVRQAAVQAGLPAERLTVAATPQQLQSSVRNSRYGAEVWKPLIYVVIALLFLESFLAQLFGRRG